jgi:hypothetical protein
MTPARVARLIEPTRLTAERLHATSPERGEGMTGSPQACPYTRPTTVEHTTPRRSHDPLTRPRTFRDDN